MKIIFSIILFALFSLPIIQHKAQIFPRFKLHNFNSNERKPKFNYENIVSGKYQPAYESYFLKQSGFYELFTKLNNSLNYNFFKMASGKNDQTVMGKNYNLFERIHLMDLNGVNNYSLAHYTKLSKIKRLQDYLESQNKNFLLVIHPSKALFEEQDILESFKTNKQKPRTIVAIEKLIKKLGINYINVTNNLPKDSFTNSGAHLHNYAKCQAIEYISKFVNSKKELLPDFKCIKTGTEAPSGEDLDLGKLINVFSYEKSIKPVPSYKVQINKSTTPLKALIIGTSFGFGLLQGLQEAKALSDYSFLFYDKTIYQGKDLLTKPVRKKYKQSKKNYTKEFASHYDFVIMEVTEPRANQLGSDFIKHLDL